MTAQARAGLRAEVMRMSERELQSNVSDCCHVFGFVCWHDHDSRRNRAGFPDLVIIAPGGVLYRELKDARRKPTAAQLDILARLRAAGADADLWRPADWFSGRITAELVALRQSR